MNERIVVITGAHQLPRHAVDNIPDSAIIIAVDGGLDHALHAGLHPSGLIGDLDSVTPEGLAWAQEHATISRHPADKDRTDTELALSFAAAMLPSGITLIGGGDRLDHTISAIGALGAMELTTVPEIDAWWDGQHVSIVHGPGRASLRLVPGSTLSMLALHGPCEKVSITGVRWELDNVRLEPVVGLGVSNEVIDVDAGLDAGLDAGVDGDRSGLVEITLSSGILTIFDQPASPAPASPSPASVSKDTSA